MPEYLVNWAIEINADSPEAAAEEALRIHRDKDSYATVFEVNELVETKDDKLGTYERGPTQYVKIDVNLSGTVRL